LGEGELAAVEVDARPQKIKTGDKLKVDADEASVEIE